jgi:putative IMPACT (imprinted ancient) family translation regulator
MHQILNVVSDRGSRYAVSGGPVRDIAGVEAFLARLKSEKRFARATHNSWAVILSDRGPLRNDDGEADNHQAILLGEPEDEDAVFDESDDQSPQ